MTKPASMPQSMLQTRVTSPTVNQPSPLHRATRAIPLLLAACLAIRLCFTSVFPGPDELEHLSYAAILQESHQFLMRFETAVTLYRSDITLWSDRVNYIGHPPPYYHYIAAFLDRALPMTEAVGRVRLASLALVLAGLAAALLGGLRAFKAYPALAAAFAIGIAWCPEILSVANYVNNDALGILAGGIAYWGAVRQGSPGRAAMATGLALGLWAKPNAGLEIGIFTGLLWLLVPPLLTRRRDWRTFAALALGAAIGILPTIPIVLRYGAIVPVAAETVWNVRSMTSFGDYWPVFLAGIGQTWGYFTFARWPMPDAAAWARTIACWTLLTGALAGGLLATRRLQDLEARIAAAAAITFAIVLPLHFGFSATRLGFSIPAASFRYYLPLWPGLLHAVLFLATPTRPRWTRPAILAAAALILALGYLVADNG